MMQAQPYICDLAPYQPGLPIELVASKYGLPSQDIVKLASNENPFGPSPRALQAMRRAAAAVHRYPEQYALTQALAVHLGVGPDSLVIGNGSNDVLDLIARTYLNESEEAIVSQYAFAMYHIATQSTGATTVTVLANEYGHDLDAMLAAITPATKVIWIANPNNPTGTFVPHETVKRFLDKVPYRIAVVLDEAYYEYLSQKERIDTTKWLSTYPNLIIVRTFSKIYGLAGLRIGYGIATPETAALLNRVRQPFNANNLAIAAATAAIQDQAFVAKSYALNTAGRRQLTQSLLSLGSTCLPSFGNFVTFEIQDSAGVVERLLQQGIIVRPLAGYGMQEWVRVTVGLPDENERFITALAAIVQP